MKVFSALALSLALLPGVVSAYSDGPFVDINALNTYWNGTSTGGALTQIYVDGTKVFERSGFGPAFVKQYFGCATGGDIRTVCGAVQDGAVDINDVLATFSPGYKVYLDGALYRAGSPSAVAGITTCFGDASYYGNVQYYKITSISAFVAYSSTCY